MKNLVHPCLAMLQYGTAAFENSVLSYCKYLWYKGNKIPFYPYHGMPFTPLPWASCFLDLMSYSFQCWTHFQISFFGHTTWHKGSQFPNQGSNPWPLQWKLGILTTEPSAKSMRFFFFINHSEYLVDPSYMKIHAFYFAEILLNYFFGMPSTISLFFYSKIAIINTWALKLSPQFLSFYHLIHS